MALLWCAPARAGDDAYRDVLIEGGTLPMALVDEAPPVARGGGDGLSRGHALEVGWTRERLGAQQGMSHRASWSGHLDTENWGRLDAQALMAQRTMDQGLSAQTVALQLAQRDMPLDRNWRAWHEFGDVLLPVLSSAARQPRWSLSTARVTGAVGRWEDTAARRTWHLGVGRTGAWLDRSTVSSLDRELGAQAVVVGSEWRDEDAAAASMAYAWRPAARGGEAVGAYHHLRGPMLAGLAQGNLLWSRGPDGLAGAVWADASTRLGTDELGAGLRVATGGVQWLGSPIAEGAGAYARWRGVLDGVSTYLEGDALRQGGRLRSGASASADWGDDGVAWTARGFLTRQGEDWQCGTQMAREAAWSGVSRGRLRPFAELELKPGQGEGHMTVGVHVSGETAAVSWRTGFGWPVWAQAERTGWAEGSVSAQLTPTMGLSGHVRGRHGRRKAGSASFLDASIAADWRPASGWLLSLQGTAVRGTQTDTSDGYAAAAGPLPGLVAPAAALRGSMVSLALQYQWGAGQMARSSKGSGTVFGQVFFDTNRNGRQDPDERGAAGITLHVNKRYTARTDATGRYTLTLPAAERYEIGVALEGLPLPWTPATELTPFSVSPRGDHRVDLALVPS